MNQLLPPTKFDADKKAYLENIQTQADKTVDKFIIGFFILGLCLAPVYDTWIFSLVASSLNIIVYLIGRFAISNKFYSHNISGIVLAVFMFQFIGQMHGLAELHFFFFVNAAILLMYQDWRVFIPYTVIVVIHHSVLAYYQEVLGVKGLEIYFISSVDKITLLQLAFHYGIVVLMVVVCISWAIILKNNSKKLLEANIITQQNQELRTAQEEAKQKNEELLATEEELRQNLEELQTTQEQLVTSKELLDNQQQQLQRFFNSIPNYLYEAELDLATQTFHTRLNNNAGEKIYGISQEELKQDGGSIFRVILPEDVAILQNAVGQAINTQQTQQVEYRIKKGEEIRWLRGTMLPSMTARNTILFTGIVQDITDYKIAAHKINEQNEILLASEEELRQNLEELQATQDLLQQQKQQIENQSAFQQSILDNATSIIIATDANGIITSFNKAGEQALGYKAEELVGKLPPAAFHDLSEVAAYAPILSAELGEEIPIGFEIFIAKSKKGLKNIKEWTYIRKDGTRFLVELSISAIRNDENEITGYLGIATDITERKQAEAETTLLTTLMDNSTDAFQVAADSGKLIYMNQAGLSRLGLQKEQIKQLWVRDYEKIFEAEGSWEAHVAEMKELKQLTVQSINYDKGNNRDFPVEVSIRYVEVEGQNYLVATSRDITERKKAEEFIKQQNEDLAASEEELRQNLEELQATQEQLITSKELLDNKQQQLQRFFNSIPNYLYEAELDLATQTFHTRLNNNAGEKIYGISQEELKQDGGSIFRVILPEDVAILQNAVGQAINTQQAQQVEYRIKKGEEVRWLQGTMLPSMTAHNTILFTGVVQDITDYKIAAHKINEQNEILLASEEELKQNLEELSATQEALQNTYLEIQGQFNAIDASMGYIEFNTQRQFIKVNKLACKLLGYDEQELKGVAHSLVVPEKYRLSSEYEEFWQKLLQGQTFMGEFERIGKNGNTIWLYASYSPVLDTEGNVVKIVKLAADITEDKKLAEEIKLKNEALAVSEKELRQNFEELNATQEQLKTQFEILAIKNKNIADSINYAKRIQEALLPRLAEIQSVFPESFVFFKPRDIISGDFYWFANKGTEQIIVAADCTGHGVPGAFMSMLGSSLLNQIVHDKEIHAPNLILDLLHSGVEDMLNQRLSDSDSRDGMDAAICLVNQETQTIQFGGANNPMYVIAKEKLNFVSEPQEHIIKITENGDFQLTEIKGDKRPIGGRIMKHTGQNYTSQSFKIDQELHIYLFSDGIIDQIGGEKRSKLLSKGFKQLLLDSHEKPANEQNQFFSTFFADWISGTQKQLDDILVIGIKMTKE